MKTPAFFQRQKGLVKRTPREEARLRVRLLDGLHTEDVIERVIAEIGSDGGRMGPVDVSRVPLAQWVDKRNKAYSIPPAVTHPDLAALDVLSRAIGDASAKPTITRYAKIGARPMPTVMMQVSRQETRYRLGCNSVGVVVGWSKEAKRPFLQVISADDLEVIYASDNPLSPTVIRWRRCLPDGTVVYDVSDLTDPEHPVYRTEGEQGDAISEESGDDYFWRYSDGRPFHRIILSGDTSRPYLNIGLVEGTLRVAAGYSYFWASMRDAGHPTNHAIGLEYGRRDTISGEGQGISALPTVVHEWTHQNPDKPGTLLQLGPGFDPEVIGKAIRSYEQNLLSSFGLPVAFESTGGEPQAWEAEGIESAIVETYPDCRGSDVLKLRRVAAVINRAGEALIDEGDARPYPPIPESGYGVLYRDEIVQEMDDAAGNEGPGDEDEGGGKPPRETGRDAAEEAETPAGGRGDAPGQARG